MIPISAAIHNPGHGNSRASAASRTSQTPTPTCAHEVDLAVIDERLSRTEEALTKIAEVLEKQTALAARFSILEETTRSASERLRVVELKAASVAWHEKVVWFVVSGALVAWLALKNTQ